MQLAVENMKNLSKPPTFGSLILVISLFFHMNPTSIIAQGVDGEEGQFDYLEDSPRGPSRWGELREDWRKCSDGRMQSPIDITPQNVIPWFTLLKLIYKPANATLRNRGQDIQVDWIGDAGSVQVNGVNFSLQSAHWHAPSEHTINGRRYALELHLVHESVNPRVENNVTVIAQLYDIGQEEPFLAQFRDDIIAFVNNRTLVEIDQGVVDPREIDLVGKRDYFRYFGSLTTPPCSEGVIWIVNREINTVTREQVRLLQEAVDESARENARPLQPLNGRRIFYQLF